MENTWNSSLKDSSFHKTKPKDKIHFTFSSSPQQMHHQIHKAPHLTNAPPHPIHKLQTQTQQTHLDQNLQREGENSKRDREQIWRRVLQLTIKRVASLFLSVSLCGGGGKEKCLRKGRKGRKGRARYEIL